LKNLFKTDDNRGRYALQLNLITNSLTAGTSGAFKFEIISPESNQIAVSSINPTIEFLLQVSPCDASCS